MDVRGILQRTDQRPATSGVHRNLRGMRLFQHGARIVGDLVEALIAADGGDANHIDVRIADRQQQRDRIIMPGIAIQNDFSYHIGSPS